MKNYKGIDNQVIANILQKHGILGASIAVVDQSKIVYNRPFGVCEGNEKQKITKNTLFEVASISKTVFAAAIMKLYEEGKLDINKDINEYLTHWKLEKKTKRDVTLKQLLSHTGGVNVNGFDGYKKGEPIPSTLDVLNGKGNSERIVSNLTKYSYSGGGFTVAEYLIEEMFPHLTYQEFMQKYVFSHVKMRHVKFYTHLKRGDKEAAVHYNIYPEFAAAGLYTTAHDLALFGIALQKSVAGKGYMDQKVADTMLTKVKDSEHGIGFMVDDDSKYFWHSGVNNSYYSHVIFTRDGKGIVILTNGDSEEVFAEIEEYIAKQCGWTDFDIQEF